MGNYERYISSLKSTVPSFDGDKMYSQIQRKISRRSRSGKILWTGASLVLLVCSFFLGNYYSDLTAAETLSEYVMGQNGQNGSDQIMSYVFSD